MGFFYNFHMRSHVPKSPGEKISHVILVQVIFTCEINYIIITSDFWMCGSRVNTITCESCEINC